MSRNSTTSQRLVEEDSDSFEEKKVYDWVDKIEPRLTPDWLDDFK